MTLPETQATLIRAALAEHRRWAERAEQAPDLEAAREALRGCWAARIHAYDLINDAEREARAGTPKMEQAA